jgi:RecB family exonuclease
MRTISKVKVFLGLKADGSLPMPIKNTLGEVTVGPLGFLALMETQLSIPAIDTPFTTRLIQYLACIDSCNHPGAFYHASYAADPFSVARTLLQWRDQWYLAGWNGACDADSPARLLEMASIEAVAKDQVDAGLGQRIQHAISLLADNTIAIESITLLDPLEQFSYLWQQLILHIDAPAETSMPITPQGAKNTDLLRLQHHLLAESTDKLTLNNDGSFLVLRAESPEDSCAAMAQFTQNRLTASGDNTLAILTEVRGDLLDEAFEANHTPRLGFQGLSPWRPVFQVLPLACELLWEPLNANALFQFLSHPIGPIPARFREKLAQTAADNPGIGSDAWNETLNRCLEKEEEDKRQRHVDNIQYWLQSPRFSPNRGVDSQTLIERAQRVADWLLGSRSSTDESPRKALYNIALNQVAEFIDAVKRLQAHGRDPLTRENVLRLIQDVRGTGAPVVDRFAEVSPDQSRAYRASHSGSFYAPVNTVVWWDCQAADHVQRWPWSNTERKSLAENGVHLHTEDSQLSWLGQAWQRPILQAQQQCIIVLHQDAERQHPVWEQIVSITQGVTIHSLSNHASAEALQLTTTALPSKPLPAKQRWWQLPGDTTLPKRYAESFSSLDTYINSPYQWLLNYAARIRPGSLTSLSDGSLLRGNLTHHLFEDFFNRHHNIQGINPADIANWVDSETPLLLTREGALLLAPGQQAERERFISILQSALRTLVVHLQQADVVSLDMELWQEGNFAGGRLNGSIDILAHRADGREAVVDIKWGGRSYRRKSMLEGSYLQLATYAQLRRGGDNPAPSLSYFIVLDEQMLNLDHDFFPEGESVKPAKEESWGEYWHRFENTYKWRKQQFDQGLIEVTVADTDSDEHSAAGEGTLDIPEASDVFNDFHAITGWGADA